MNEDAVFPKLGHFVQLMSLDRTTSFRKCVSVIFYLFCHITISSPTIDIITLYNISSTIAYIYIYHNFNKLQLFD